MPKLSGDDKPKINLTFATSFLLAITSHA